MPQAGKAASTLSGCESHTLTTVPGEGRAAGCFAADVYAVPTVV